MKFKEGDIVYFLHTKSSEPKLALLIYIFMVSYGGKVWRISDLKSGIEFLCHEDDMFHVTEGIKAGIQTGIL